MRRLIVTVPFRFAHQGIHVEEYLVSDSPQLATDECARLAIDEGWAHDADQLEAEAAAKAEAEAVAAKAAAEAEAQPVQAPAPAAKAAKPPKNKALDGAPDNKTED